MLYDKRRDIFLCYLDSLLNEPDIHAALRKKFRLAECQVRFESDLHYTTDPDELDRLFEN